MASKGHRPDLGFVEETESWRLLSHFFPSKVGGKPAWLSLKPLPRPEDVTCTNCGKPCVFLLQVYAPDQSKDTCFHRAVFVFVCRDPSCCKPNSNGNFVVLRSQIPRVNEFYSHEPPKEDDFDPEGEYPRADKHESVCLVCGGAGPKRCGRCQKATYCSKDHQTVDWKGGHKTHCKEGAEKVVDHSSFLLREFELVMEEEEEIKDQPVPEKSEEEKMKEYESLVASKETGTLDTEAVEGDLDKMARTETSDDKVFRQFKKRMAHEPEQVLRYDRGGLPLWVSSDKILLDKDIPPCSCGSARNFEFQVMPQLLNYLKLDELQESIDWGTLVVYTCSANCDIGSNYQKEFLWKQDFTNSDSV